MKGIMFAIMAGLFFAGTQSFDKLALSKYDIAPLWGVVMCGFVALLLVTIVAWQKGDLNTITPDMKQSVWALVGSGFCYSIAISSMFWAFTILPAGQSAAIHHAVGVTATMFLSVMFLSEQMTWVKAGGVVFCVMGIILVAK